MAESFGPSVFELSHALIFTDNGEIPKVSFEQQNSRAYLHAG